MSSVRTPLAIALDALLVVVFALSGRASHAERLDLAGIATTAWPFLAALALGWVIVAALRWLPTLIRTGMLLWAVTLGGGMALRVLTGGTTAVAFIVVAGVTLALFLIGWRAIATLVVRRATP